MRQGVGFLMFVKGREAVRPDDGYQRARWGSRQAPRAQAAARPGRRRGGPARRAGGGSADAPRHRPPSLSESAPGPPDADPSPPERHAQGFPLKDSAAVPATDPASAATAADSAPAVAAARAPATPLADAPAIPAGAATYSLPATQPPSAADPDADLAASIDGRAHALWAQAWSSLSPESVALAWFDWASHLATSPGKCVELARLGGEQAQALAEFVRQCCVAGPTQARASIEPPVQDRRFGEPPWCCWPFSLWHQAFLLTQQWWESATTGVWGVERHHEKVVGFCARQWLDVFSPGNHLLTNPVALKRTVDEGGANLVRGYANLQENIRRRLAGLPPVGAEDFQVGRDVAATPGKVVLRNRLMELIQYSPRTRTVRPEPVLVMPAWIMKYYILDLSPGNSLIGYLVSQGYTVFCISWKNPGREESDLGMEDYVELGFEAALEAIEAIVPGRRVHATGYCLGGTLLAIAAAAMVRDGRAGRLASLSLFTAQTDFSEPGELGLFVDESQVSLLEAQMAQTGYLRADQMAAAFEMLRSYDLLWSRRVREYLLGERRPMTDLMAWNADATRMPARMHSQYLRGLFLNNDLAHGRHLVGGRPVSLGSLNLPTFCVGTATDHVAPWKSVYKLHYLCPAEITFVLTSGGHNAGIVSEPGHPRRQYQATTRPAGGGYVSPEEWQATVAVHQGSWWPQWLAWLRARSGAPVRPPAMGAPARGLPVLYDAPGAYVREK